MNATIHALVSAHLGLLGRTPRTREDLGELCDMLGIELADARPEDFVNAIREKSPVAATTGDFSGSVGCLVWSYKSNLRAIILDGDAFDDATWLRRCASDIGLLTLRHDGRPLSFWENPQGMPRALDSTELKECDAYADLLLTLVRNAPPLDPARPKA